MPTTIVDLARQLNISVGTVSKALNGYRDVSDATRLRVQEAAREMGYHPSTAARNLRQQRTGKIGVVVNYPIDIVNDFLAEFIPAAASVAEGADYDLILYSRADDRPEQLAPICRAPEVDGLLLLWPAHLTQAARFLKREGMPCVVLPRRTSQPGIAYIAADHVTSGRQLTQHLIDLGHQRIGFTSRPDLRSTNTDRLQGYRQALDDAGLEFDAALVLPAGNVQGGAGASFLEAFLEMDLPPTAILCFTDVMALQALADASARGVRVPADLSIAGHDGILASGLAIPALTTARQPIPQMGRLAVEGLLAQILDPRGAAQRHVLPIELIIRHSTGEAPACMGTVRPVKHSALSRSDE